ncbi:permease [Terrihalobacillus insolitus]|uniref:permease n=1 Tax=Terrihalobacillus insolitus TaxID=2950438 RepID=UPI00233FF9D9|nr:permease [Terrihalobacillus insolitus]MDC3414759.1 permease [Terrihalobacillus insolitus]
MDYSRVSFVILGILFSVMTGFMIFAGFMADTAPPSMTYITLALTVMSLSLSYLYPQFRQKDERMKLIRQKGMFASFVAMAIYIMAFNIGLQFELITLTANQLIQALTVLMISTLFISFVVYSKIY